MHLIFDENNEMISQEEAEEAIRQLEEFKRTMQEPPTDDGA